MLDDADDVDDDGNDDDDENDHWEVSWGPSSVP